jgi:Arc/MetJ-type ribon-helix-helix transcriptional regulator
MSKQIAVRLPDDLVDFVDEIVDSGTARSRAIVVTRALVVLPTHVVNAADRRPVPQRAVRATPVVVAKEGWHGSGPLG